MGRWDGLGPVATAVAALAVLVLLPEPSEPEAEAAFDGEVAWGDADPPAGSVLPLKLYRDNAGTWCRDYLVIGADPTAPPESRTACLQADGSWEVRTGPQLAEW